MHKQEKRKIDKYKLHFIINGVINTTEEIIISRVENKFEIREL